MDENLTLKDIQSNPVELPYSVQLALQTVEFGKLTRARAVSGFIFKRKTIRP